jgi:hypothetical protein
MTSASSGFSGTQDNGQAGGGAGYHGSTVFQISTGASKLSTAMSAGEDAMPKWLIYVGLAAAVVFVWFLTKKGKH